MGAIASGRPTDPTLAQPPGTAYFLRLARSRWDDMEIGHLGRPAATVIGAWLLLAWARFGPQLIDDPQAVVRFVLVGVYGWLMLSILVSLASRLVGRRQSDTARPVPTLEATVAKVGLAHQALAVGGFTIQIVQILPIQILTSIVAAASIVWMGGQLAGAIASLQQRSSVEAAPFAAGLWLLWLAVNGSYLWNRLGHLI